MLLRVGLITIGSLMMLIAVIRGWVSDWGLGMGVLLYLDADSCSPRLILFLLEVFFIIRVCLLVVCGLIGRLLPLHDVQMQSKLALWLRLWYEIKRSYSFIEVDWGCVLRGVTQGLVQVGCVRAFFVDGSMAWLLAVGLIVLELAQVVLVHLV